MSFGQSCEGQVRDPGGLLKGHGGLREGDGRLFGDHLGHVRSNEHSREGYLDSNVKLI